MVLVTMGMGMFLRVPKFAFRGGQLAGTATSNANVVQVPSPWGKGREVLIGFGL